jgi:hypothetical protein
MSQYHHMKIDNSSKHKLIIHHNYNKTYNLNKLLLKFKNLNIMFNKNYNWGSRAWEIIQLKSKIFKIRANSLFKKIYCKIINYLDVILP